MKNGVLKTTLILCKVMHDNVSSLGMTCSMPPTSTNDYLQDLQQWRFLTLCPQPVQMAINHFIMVQGKTGQLNIRIICTTDMPKPKTHHHATHPLINLVIIIQEQKV